MSGGDILSRFGYNARKKGAAKMTATVNDQSITITDESLTVSESVGIYECDFTFDASWGTWNKTAVFEGAGETIEMIVVDNKAQIPWEVLKEAGWIKIGVYGTKGGEIKPTIWSDQIYVAAGTVPGSVEVTPTPSIYAQILDLANDAKDIAEDAQDTADDVASDWASVSATATTLSAGSPATVTFADNTFAFGIPKGAKGDTGATGATGATPDFSIGTVSTLETGQPATATITGTAAQPVLNLGLPKGNKGDNGDVANIADAYSTSATYAVGDYCIYSSQLYRCTTAITTAEAWTAAHWSAVALGDDTRDLRSALNATNSTLRMETGRSGNLPFVSNKSANVTLNSVGKIFNGNGNFIDLFNIEDGTYTQNGVTVTITKNGSRIMLNGTSTSAFYFILNDDTGSSASFIKDYILPNYPFKIGTTHLSGGQSGTTCSLCLRKNPSTGGNAFTWNLGDAVTSYTATLSDGDYLSLYLYFNSNSTYTNYVIDLSLYFGDPVYTEPNTEVIEATTASVKSRGCITASVAGSAVEYEEMTAENVLPRLEEVEEKTDLAKPIISKELDKVLMYVPVSNKKGYLEYSFIKVDDADINALGWRLRNLYLTKTNKTQVEMLCTTGEWEMALQIAGRSDFIGLGNHGDEIQTSFKLFIDGAEVLETDTFTDKEWSKAQLVTTLAMYDPNDHTTIVGYHTRIDTVDAVSRKVTIQNKVEFVQNLSLSFSYLFMCPIMRTYNGKQITDTFIDDKDYVLTDCSTTTFNPTSENNGVGRYKEGVTEYDFWGADYKINGYAKIIRRILPSGVAPISYVSSADAYNKIYLSACGYSTSVASGDIWIMETEFYLDSGYDFS